MARETCRRLFLLAVVAVASAGWMIVFHGTVVPATQTAAAASTAPAPHVKPCPFPPALRPAFEAAARDAAVPRAMLYAVAKVESNLRADAKSEAGARGLLQVMPATGKELALNINEPASNVLAGARYLRQLLDRFGNSDLALASYNAGPTAVSSAGGPPSIAVQRYIANVNNEWHAVAGCR